MKMLNSRGVTAIKEMCFDDYYGFADEMASREAAGDLTVRVDMMSQPVGRGADLAYARSARERFQGPFVRFSGFNRMTDRGLWCGLAEMIEPYEEGADAGAAGKTVVEEPEWDLISRELAEVDAEGFRYSLHCQGDGAVRKTVELCRGLPRDERGRLARRHSITDLENSDPADLEAFGSIGGICEVYPQILTLDAREDCLSTMRRQIGETRLEHSWNRRGMVDAGCIVCCGTDLPLLTPHLGDSIYSACGGYFADGLPVNQGNALTVAELLRAWTFGGAYDLEREDELGTLEPGKLADICVLDADAFSVDPRDARSWAWRSRSPTAASSTNRKGVMSMGETAASAPRLRREQISGMNIHYIMWSLDYFLDAQQRIGFKSIELWGAEPHVTLDHTGYFEADQLRRKIESRGLNVSSLCPENVVYPWQYAARKPLHAERSIAYFKHGVELAEVLGAPYMSINSGWGDWDEDREEAWKRSREHLSILADFAGEHGVTLTMESLRPEESNLVITLADARRMLDEVASPNIVPMVDTTAMGVAGRPSSSGSRSSAMDRSRTCTSSTAIRTAIWSGATASTTWTSSSRH